ncbi:MAG: glycosyltransferase [Planctomycetota bacterium]
MSVTLWHILAWTLWPLWLAMVAACAMQTGKFSRRLVQADRPGFEEFRPPAVVFVPFKGLDSEATANLHGLLKLDYPDYRLVLIVESEDDPAYDFLRDELDKAPHVWADIVVAGEAPADTGQKVHNLLTGIAHAEATDQHDPDSDSDSELGSERAWVFADSDAIPGADWLGNLVGPLGRPERNSVTTGYRWFVPPRGPITHWNVPAQWASGINAGIATFASHEWFRFAWGGSMAILRSSAIEGGLVARWEQALSDDYQMTRMARALRKARKARPEHGTPPRCDTKLLFVPECLVESPINFTFGQLREFGVRQYRITKVYAPKLFWGAWLALAVYLSAYLLAWGWLLLGAVTGHWRMSLLALSALLLAFGLNRFRAYMRRETIRTLFGNGTYDRLVAVHAWDRWLPELFVAVNFGMMLLAAWGRTITWRGKRYRMRRPQRIQRRDLPLS